MGIILEDINITLRPLNDSFFNAYAAMFSAAVRSILHVPSVENELDYLRSRLQKMADNRTLFYCVFDRRCEQLIGAIEIRHREEHPGQLYSWMNERYWGNGWYQQALHVAAQSYFTVHKHERFFTAHVDSTNLRSYYALKKAGFAQSGIIHGPYGKQYALLLRNTIK